MLNIGLTKLQLDDAVGGEEITLDGEVNNGKDDQTAKEVRKSLLTTLRNKFEAGDGKGGPRVREDINGTGEKHVVKEEQAASTPMKKKARASIAASQVKEEEVKEAPGTDATEDEEGV